MTTEQRLAACEDKLTQLRHEVQSGCFYRHGERFRLCMSCGRIGKIDDAHFPHAVGCPVDQVENILALPSD